MNKRPEILGLKSGGVMGRTAEVQGAEQSKKEKRPTNCSKGSQKETRVLTTRDMDQGSDELFDMA